ncbi:uncharacterized protein LOC113306132 [Papaver somniferum]|uniref:uncharacterized protein LOC113306132 n=1 Tax=Papaver somniferum TaxID=3469 RepID=UPI000E6FB150|nr:uncharacterized protein LOC113306132 [Papaver somniferum]
MEARKWHSRAKQNEFKWGDSNTSYFFRIANARKKRNTIVKLDVEGVECFDQNIIKMEMKNFYQKLYTEDNNVAFTLDKLEFPRIDEGEQMEMKKEFTEEEVYGVIKKSGANKSPRPDGFSMEFYKCCWSIIKEDFMKVMGEFYRLRGVMHKLVSENQGAFVKERQILDGVLIAGECIDSRLKEKKPGVLCKIDMEKAFDRVKWKTMLRILEKHGFGVLSKLVKDAVLRGQMHGFRVAENGIMVSHLQFADDTLIFINAKVEEIRRLFIILNTFEMLTGLKLYLDKSSMISVGVDEVIKMLAMELGCKVEKLPIRYLGLPLGATSRCASVWDEVVQRMEDSSNEKRKMCWVSWLKICKPKALGGLGVKNLRGTSKALKAKWIWRYTREKRALWRKIVQQKFKNNGNILMPSDDVRPMGRSVWKNIMNSSTFLQGHLEFKLNNGKSLRFWLDNWIVGGLLNDRYPAVYKACNTKLDSVEEMIQNGILYCSSRRRLSAMEQLEWDMLCNELGPVHGLNEEEDTVEFFGGFTVKICYELQVQEEPVGDFSKFLWKKNVPPKGSFMVWVYFHHSLPTRTMLTHRGMEVQSEYCVFCNAALEIADHMLLQCDYAFQVWSRFMKGFNIAWVVPDSVLNQFEA